MGYRVHVDTINNFLCKYYSLVFDGVNVEVNEVFEVPPLLWNGESLGYTISEGGALFHERTCCP